MPGTLTRDDIIDGVGEVIARLRDSGIMATIQIVGGAAIALTIDGDRTATVDVDGAIVPVREVEAVAARIASERGWPLDWINDRAKIFVPEGVGRSAEWITLYDAGGIVVQAGSPAMLLAMKLRAVERRGLRDIDDVAVLLTVNGIETADDAEDLLNEFFPGEDLSPRTYERVQTVWRQGRLPSHDRPFQISPDERRCGAPPRRWRPASVPLENYFTLPAVRPPTRRFSMSMKRMTTGRIATIETPNTYCQLVSY